MKELILKQIQSFEPAIILSLGIIVIPLIAAILTVKITGYKPKKLLDKLTICIVPSIILLIGIISFVPVANLIFNLTRDYHEQTILVKEGYIDRKLARAKLPAIEINDEVYIMSPQVVKAEVGEYCVIEYFEHSKYIYSLYIEKP